MKLVRFLFLFSARHNINILRQHIPGYLITLLMLCIVYRYNGFVVSAWGSSTSIGRTTRALEYLDLIVAHCNQTALAPSALSTYASGVHSYQVFCQHTGLPILLLVEETLQRFVVSLTNRVGYKCIKVYLSGTQFSSIMAGFNIHIGSSPRLFYLLRGISPCSRFSFQSSSSLSCYILSFTIDLSPTCTPAIFTLLPADVTYHFTTNILRIFALF